MAKSTLFRNLKFRAFQGRLGIQRIYAQAHLDALWETAHTQGRPWFRSPEEVEMAAEWEGEPGVMFAALMAGVVDGDAGFIEALPDGTFGIHDYFEHLNDGLKKAYMRKLNLTFADVTNLSVLQFKDLQRKNVAQEQPETKKLSNGCPPTLPIPSDPLPSDPLPSPDVSTREVDNHTQGVDQASPENPPSGGGVPSSSDTSPAEPENGKCNCRVTLENFRDAWNAVAATCQIKTMRLTAERRRALATRLKSPEWRDSWRDGVAAIPRVAWLTGANKRGWTVTPEWFLRNDTNLARVLEEADGKETPQDDLCF